MHSCRQADHWITRAQVWLGTLVEVSLSDADATEACFAAAFAAVAHVHRKMSVHDSGSDLVRIARIAHLRAVTVDPDTHAVLILAQTLFYESRGAFDVTVAPVLARRGLLPARAAARHADCGMEALHLERGCRVRATAPVSVDLGGIAKGYAVDRAVAAVRAMGARSGFINAGGDLRVFGTENWLPVRVRHPQMTALAVPLFDVREAAVATSADYFRRALVNPRTQRLQPLAGSVTVVAPSCALADAMTKIIALQPARASAILARHGVHAFRLDVDDDGLRARTTFNAPTKHLRQPFLEAA
jgi:FAD:protein FMN transferase